MNVCEDGHEEIVFNVRRCPLCYAVKEIKRLETEIESYDNTKEEK